MEEKKEFEFKTKIIDGKPVVQAVVERRPNKQGGVDIIIHAPSMNLINKLKEN